MNTPRIEDAHGDSSPTRRRLLRAVSGGLVLAASGLFQPDWLEEAEAREGALGGAMGGRGKNRRRHKRRSQGGKRDKQKVQDKPRGGGCINALSMTLIFSNISRRDHLMSVADGGGDCDNPLKYRRKTRSYPWDRDLSLLGGTRKCTWTSIRCLPPCISRLGILARGSPV